MLEFPWEEGSFPWTVKPCTGQALQLLVLDRDDRIVMMSEMYSIQDMKSFLILMQRNRDVKVDAVAFQSQFGRWEKDRA